MRLLKISFLVLVLAFGLNLSLVDYGHAVNPDEVLENAELEARARNLSATIRCMKCQNQSIDDSDADLAHDLRLLVRERLVAGDSDQQVLDYLVDRYGEFVLLKPSFSLPNLFLWFAPILVLLAGLFLSLRVMRKKPADGESAVNTLSKAEHDQLTKILGDQK